MDRDILEVMQEKMQTFSKGQRRIVQYMLESGDKAAFMTASKLGRTVGVSESTVVRFAVDLGFDGYPAMQKAMQKLVLGRLTTGQWSKEQGNLFDNRDLLSRALQSDMDSLRRAGETLDRGAFQAAVKAISDAKQVYVIGTQAAAPLVHFLGNHLGIMIPNVQSVTASDPEQLFKQVMGVDGETAVIALSFLKVAAAITTAVEYCRDNGATVVAITDNHESKLAKVSDHVIWVPSEKSGAVDSLVVPMCVINALVTAVATVRERERRRNIETLERLLNQYHVDEKRVEEK